MKRFIFILLWGVFFLPALKAQQVKEVVATANNDTIIVSCQLETTVFCALQLQYSDNNGLTWNTCRTVQGDIANQASGKKTIYWNCLKDDVMMGNFLFKVVARPTDVPVAKKEKEENAKPVKSTEKEQKPQSKPQEKIAGTKGSFFILPGISFGKTTAYSLMVGYGKKWGGYLKVKSSFGSKDKNAVEGDVDDAFYNGNAKKGRTSFYAGTIGRLHPNIYLYVGVGYGNKWLQWETVDNTMVEIQSGSYSGFDPEIGVLFRIKKFTIGGGLNCLIGEGHKNGEGNISLGFMF